MGTPKLRELRRAYGFDEVAIVPGDKTVNPELVDTGFSLNGFTFKTPILAAAMDAIVSPGSASVMHKLGGLSVMNLEGIQTRYDDTQDILDSVINSTQDEETSLLQSIYSAPIDERLIASRVSEMKDTGAICAVSVTPANTKRFAPVAAEAGADVIVVQSTVTTARHISTSTKGLRFPELMEIVNIPILVGNCVSYDVALELMETGIQGLLVGIGPGAACTTREVTGVGVPQVTATLDCSAARDEYYQRSGRYVPIITDGGIRTGGDLCKAIVAGADAVMLGTPLAQAKESPGRGYNWGMANPHPDLPRGTRVKVGVKGTLSQILFGPTSLTDGTQNLVGALRVCMGMVGCTTINEMHDAELVIAPSIKTEGKHLQHTAL